MAKITLGIGSAHGPMLHTSPENWGARVKADRANTKHVFKGKTYSFNELTQLRADERLNDEITLEKWRERHAACQSALAELKTRYAAASPDVAVIFGNDQREFFIEDMMPAFCVYWGETIENIPISEERKAKLPPGVVIAEAGHCPPEGATYPGAPGLGRFLIESLMNDGFDVAQFTRYPSHADHPACGIPHAFGFLYRQVMSDNPPPSVPLFTNTFFPPNQPTARRSAEFGRAVARAIAAWDGAGTAALLSSGGLSHMVVDAELDRMVIEAFKKNDIDALVKIPEEWFQSGTSEIKNWIPLAAAAAEVGLKVDYAEYVPCFRSEAGTGNGMGFVAWS